MFYTIKINIVIGTVDILQNIKIIKTILYSYRTYFLDPEDPLFVKIGEQFIRKVRYLIKVLYSGMQGVMDPLDHQIFQSSRK